MHESQVGGGRGGHLFHATQPHVRCKERLEVRGGDGRCARTSSRAPQRSSGIAHTSELASAERRGCSGLPPPPTTPAHAVAHAAKHANASVLDPSANSRGGAQSETLNLPTCRISSPLTWTAQCIGATNEGTPPRHAPRRCPRAKRQRTRCQGRACRARHTQSQH